MVLRAIISLISWQRL